LALMVVLSSSRHAGSNSGAPLLAGLAVPLRTLERWRTWWAHAFVHTPLWRGACGDFMPPIDAQRLPASLLERVVATDATTRLSGLLRFLRPLTVRVAELGASACVDHAA